MSERTFGCKVVPFEARNPVAVIYALSVFFLQNINENSPQQLAQWQAFGSSLPAGKTLLFPSALSNLHRWRNASDCDIRGGNSVGIVIPQ